MRFAHSIVTTIAVPVWCWAFLWLWPQAVRADAALGAEVLAYDWKSMLYAAGLGLLGGALALIVALATDKRVVLDVLADALRNMLVSPIAGCIAFMALKAAAAVGWLNITTEPRFLVIIASGWAGIAFIAWARDTAAAIAQASKNKAAGKIQ